MSAFYVDPGTIDAALTLFKREQHKRSPRKFTDNELSRLGEAMSLLNVGALVARYGDKTEDYGTFYVFQELPDETDAACLKSLRCWLYQCAEGDIPETSSLWKGMKVLADNLEALETTPAYNNAPWGYQRQEETV